MTTMQTSDAELLAVIRANRPTAMPSDDELLTVIRASRPPTPSTRSRVPIGMSAVVPETGAGDPIGAAAGMASQFGKVLGTSTLNTAAGSIEGGTIVGAEAATMAPSAPKVLAGGVLGAIGRKLENPIGIPGVGIENPLDEAGQYTVEQAIEESAAKEPYRAAAVEEAMKAGQLVRMVASSLGYERSEGAMGIAEDVVGAVPQLAGAVGAGAVGTAATGGNPLGGMAAAAGFMAITDAGNQTSDIYRRLLAEGVDEREAANRATTAGTAYGLASGALEFAGVGSVLGAPLKKYMLRGAETAAGRALQAGARTAGAGTAEGLTEAAQGIVGDAASAWAADDWEGFRRTWNDLDTRGREFLVGSILGATVRGGVEALDPANYRSAEEMLAAITTEPIPGQNAGQSETSEAGAQAQNLPSQGQEAGFSAPSDGQTGGQNAARAPVRIVLKDAPVAPQPDARLADGTPVFKDRAQADAYVEFKRERAIPGDMPLRVLEPIQGAMEPVFAVVEDTRRAEAQDRGAAQSAEVTEFTRAEGRSPRQGVADPARSETEAAEPISAPATTEPATPAPSTPTPQPSADPRSSEPPATQDTPKRHKFSSTQVDLPAHVARKVQRIGRKLIPDEALAGDGRETAPHITVKYGLHTEDAAEVQRAVAGFGPIKVTLGETSTFPPSESSDGAEVVKVDVEGEDIRRLNAAIAEALDTTDTHPTYIPHVTLAYVREGMGERFSGDSSLKGTTLEINEITFSDRDGGKHRVDLTGSASQDTNLGRKPSTDNPVPARPVSDTGSIANMTRDQLLAEAERLGVAEGPKSKPSLRKRVEAARETSEKQTDPDSAAPEPIRVGDRVTLPEHTGEPGAGHNYGAIEDAEVVRVTPKFVVVRQTNTPENAAMFGETTTTRLPREVAEGGKLARGTPGEAKGSPAPARPTAGITRTLWDLADDLESKAKERIRARQIPRGRGTGATTIPQDLVDYSIVGAAKILKGATKFGQWSAAMVEDFGEDIRPSLRDIWTDSRERAGAIRGKPSDVKRTVQAETGIKDTSPEVTTTEAKALRTKLSTEERAARKAYRLAEREGRAVLRGKLAEAREQARATLREAVKTTRETEKGRAKARAETIEGLRQEARRLIEENLPTEERGKFLADLTKAQSLGGLARTIGKVINAVDRIEHRDAVTDLRKSITRARKAKLRPEFERFIDEKFGDIDVTSMTAKTRRALQATADFLEENPEAPVPPAVIERVRRLNKRSVGEMGADEIRAAADAIDMAVHLSKLKNELIGRQRGRTRKAVAAKAVQEMEARAPKLSTEPGLVTKLVGKARGREVAGGPQRGQLSMFFREGGTRPEVLLDHLSPELRELVWEDIGVYAHNDENRLIWEFRDGLREALDGQELPMHKRDGVAKWREEPVELPDGTVITNGEALWMHLTMRDPSNAQLAWRNGITLARLDQEIPVSRGMLEAIERAIGEKGRAVADHMFEQFNGRMKDVLNEAWVDVYGVEVATNESYVPRRIDMTRSDTNMDAMEQMAMDREATLTSWGHLRQRVGAAAPLEIGDAFDAFISHIDHVSRLGAYLAPTSNVYAILGRAEVKRSIIERVGRVGYDRILAAIHMQTVRTADRSEGARRVRRIMRRAGGGILGLRLSTVLLNPSGIPVSVAYLPNGFRLLAEALPSSVSALKAGRSRLGKMLKEHSPYWRTRYEDFAYQSMGGVASHRAELGPPGITELGLKPLAWSDEFGGVVRARIAELHVQKNLGIKPEDPEFAETVAREWERMMFRGENTGHGMELTGMLAEGRRNPFWAPFVAFTSSVSKIYSLATRGMLAARRAKRLLAAGDRAGAAEQSRMAATSIAGVMGSVAWASAVREILTGDDDEKKSLGERGLERFAIEAANMVPFVGTNMFVPGLRALFNDQGPTYSASLTDSMLVDGARALQDMGGAVVAWREGSVDAEGEAAWINRAKRAADGSLELAGTLSGVPYSGGKDLVRRTGLLDGMDKEPADELRKLIRDQESDRSVTGERRMVLRAVREGDDVLFRRAVERWHRARPGEPIRVSDLQSVLDTRYRPLMTIERKVGELNTTQREYLEEVRTEYGELRERMGAMIRRNRDLLGVRAMTADQTVDDLNVSMR